MLENLRSEKDLSDRLSEPYDIDVDFCRRLTGDVIVLGAGGKIGPSLVQRIAGGFARAGARNRVFAASRFSSLQARQEVAAAGAEVLPADLLNPGSVASLPRCEHVLFLAGRKFGSMSDAALTWAINTAAPAHVAEHFASSRIVAFSTGNVYGFTTPSAGGSRETDAPAPVGEYAQSCLGRERVFEYYSIQRGTPVLIFRLNYAVDLRYGVLVDIAHAVIAGRPVDLTTAHVNVIWQGDANSYALRSLAGCTSPPRVLNVTGGEILSVADVARHFGRRFGQTPVFRGEPRDVALLSDARACHEWLGEARVSADELIDAVASWIEQGGRTLGKPTHFETTDGRY